MLIKTISLGKRQFIRQQRASKTSGKGSKMRNSELMRWIAPRKEQRIEGIACREPGALESGGSWTAL
jgi:hypothetical protein